MSERGIHYVAADLETSWTCDWVGVGIVEIEAYLEKQAAFSAFLAACEGTASTEPDGSEPLPAPGADLVPLPVRLPARGARAERAAGHRLALDVGRLLAA
jgi:hypothetical protein